jgi:ABC-2 type transport system ATP-binding protein
MTTSPVIDVDGLTVTYGDVTALRDLTFHVQQGELYALLGTNGAGKTSALDVIEGRRRATSGTVRVFGSSPLGPPADRPRTGSVLQGSGLSPDLTVRESVGLIGSLSGRRDDVGRVLGVAGLARQAGSLVSQLSGGERRRLDFATAVYGGPELVVLDDPTTGLDSHSRDALWDVCAGCATTGPRSCSPPTTPTRCSSAPTGSDCCTRAPSGARARSPSSCGRCRR